MERQPHQSDEDFVNANVYAALVNSDVIEDDVALCIAGMLHDGQNSALYSLASTGKVYDRRRIISELVRTGQEAIEQLDDYDMRMWVEALAYWVGWQDDAVDNDD